MNKRISRRHRRCRGHAVGRHTATMRNVHPSVDAELADLCQASLMGDADSQLRRFGDMRVMPIRVP
jgi:hypothetical protein